MTRPWEEQHAALWERRLGRERQLRRRRRVGFTLGALLLVVFVALPLFLALAGCATTPRVGQHARPPAPRAELHVKASRSFAFAPAWITVRAELVGGDDEAAYCPAQEWIWGDGSKSVRESDCPPWTPGTQAERRYSLGHCYCAGDYNPTVTLSRGSRILARDHASVSVKWAPGGCACR